MQSQLIEVHCGNRKGTYVVKLGPKLLVLDTNCFEDKEGRLQLLSKRAKFMRWQSIAKKIGRRLVVPEIVAMELRGHFQTAFEVAVNDFQKDAKYIGELNSENEFLFQPSLSSALTTWDQDLLSLQLTPAKIQQADFREAIRREILRMPPAKKGAKEEASGARDVLVWLSALGLAKDGKNDVILVTHDKALLLLEENSACSIRLHDISSYRATDRIRTINADNLNELLSPNENDFTLNEILAMGTDAARPGLNHAIGNFLFAESKNLLSSLLQQRGLILSPYVWLEDRAFRASEVIAGASERFPIHPDYEVQKFSLKGEIQLISAAQTPGELTSGTGVLLTFEVNVLRDVIRKDETEPTVEVRDWKLKGMRIGTQPFEALT
jgi:hypothetical protein